MLVKVEHESQPFKMQGEVQGLCDSAHPGRGLGGHGPRPRGHRADDEQAARICQVRPAGERPQQDIGTLDQWRYSDFKNVSPTTAFLPQVNPHHFSQYGRPLVPAFTFGENFLYDNPVDPNSWIRSFQVTGMRQKAWVAIK